MNDFELLKRMAEPLYCILFGKPQPGVVSELSFAPIPRSLFERRTGTEVL